MNKVDYGVLVVACLLGIMGAISALALAILHGVREGNWGLLIVFLVIVGLGGTALGLASKQLVMILKERDKKSESDGEPEKSVDDSA